jgi:hypothetical protein
MTVVSWDNTTYSPLKLHQLSGRTYLYLRCRIINKTGKQHEALLAVCFMLVLAWFIVQP